jgi:hypothetical protein
VSCDLNVLSSNEAFKNLLEHFTDNARRKKSLREDVSPTLCYL